MACRENDRTATRSHHARTVASVNATASAIAISLLLVRAGAAGVTPPSVELQPIATLADQVVALANSGVAGDPRMFLVRKIGIVHVYDGTTVLDAPFLDIDDLVIGTTLTTGDERGLLGIAFHPEYADNGFFYVSYIDNSGNSAIRRYTVSANPNIANAASGVPVMSVVQPAANHNGGQVKFGPDGYLYIGMGDGGGGCDSAGAGCNAQKTNSLLGAMVRIDIDGDDFPLDPNRNYAIPATNPFVANAAFADEIWSYGLRNPWRFSFDRATGDMYIGDVGQSGGSRREEINFQAATSSGGENYGWPVAEGTQCNPGTCALTNCPTPIPSCDSLTFPLHQYSGGCAVTGGYVYRGSAIPALIGRYVYGDYCAGDITALDVSTLGTAIIADPGFELTSFGEDTAGELYVAVGTGVYKLVAEPGSPTATPTATPTSTPTHTPTSTSTPLGGGTLDVDGNGTIQGATDGVYVFRALLGLGLVVPESFRALDPTIAPDADIAAAVTALGMRLDVDGNGLIQASTDGVYVFRRLIGLQFVVPPPFRAIDPDIPHDAVIAANVDALLEP